MINIDAIMAIIIASLPTLSAIVGIIVAVIKVLKDNKSIVEPLKIKFEELKNEVKDRKEFDELLNRLDASLEQNRQLMLMNAKLLTELTKVQYDPNTNN